MVARSDTSQFSLPKHNVRIPFGTQILTQIEDLGAVESVRTVLDSTVGTV